MTLVKNSIVLIMFSLFLVACKSAPILNIDDDAFDVDKALSMQAVTAGIKRAGRGLGWRMKNQKPGLIIGTLHLRDHMAKVSIKYNTKYYSIHYQDSSNLDYKANSPNYDGQSVIHSNYNGWIQNLSNAIQQQVY